jgi:hypothetical protein
LTVAQPATPPRVHWLAAIRRYLLATAIGNLVWETAQLPFYTLWRSGTSRQIVVAIVHCTAGDAVIAAVALIMALLLVGPPDWPTAGVARTAAVAVAAGLAYAVYSEYVNTGVRAAWAYSELMPTLPWLGTGLAPLAQWLVVPSLALAWATRSRPAATTDHAKDSASRSKASAPSVTQRPGRAAAHK